MAVAHKQALLNSQFELQHTDYVSRYPNADFLLIEQHGQPIGRFYRLRTPSDHLLIDITLAAHARRQGIGRRLIEQAQCEARQHGCGDCTCGTTTSRRNAYISGWVL